MNDYYVAENGIIFPNNVPVFGKVENIFLPKQNGYVYAGNAFVVTDYSNDSDSDSDSEDKPQKKQKRIIDSMPKFRTNESSPPFLGYPKIGIEPSRRSSRPRLQSQSQSQSRPQQQPQQQPQPLLQLQSRPQPQPQPQPELQPELQSLPQKPRRGLQQSKLQQELEQPPETIKSDKKRPIHEPQQELEQPPPETIKSDKKRPIREPVLGSNNSVQKYEQRVRNIVASLPKIMVNASRSNIKTTEKNVVVKRDEFDDTLSKADVRKLRNDRSDNEQFRQWELEEDRKEKIIRRSEDMNISRITDEKRRNEYIKAVRKNMERRADDHEERSREMADNINISRINDAKEKKEYIKQAQISAEARANARKAREEYEAEEERIKAKKEERANILARANARATAERAEIAAARHSGRARLMSPLDTSQSGDPVPRRGDPPRAESGFGDYSTLPRTQSYTLNESDTSGSMLSPDPSRQSVIPRAIANPQTGGDNSININVNDIVMSVSNNMIKLYAFVVSICDNMTIETMNIFDKYIVNLQKYKNEISKDAILKNNNNSDRLKSIGVAIEEFLKKTEEIHDYFVNNNNVCSNNVDSRRMSRIVPYLDLLIGNLKSWKSLKSTGVENQLYHQHGGNLM